MGRREPQALLQAVQREQDAPVEFDQLGARLAEPAVVFGEAAKAGLLAGRKRAQSSLPRSDQESTVVVWSGPCGEAQWQEGLPQRVWSS